MYYTKYRPQKFSEISQPNDAAIALMNQIKTGKTAHAYLLVGPRGIGKTTTARVLAKALNCTNILKNGDPCTRCKNCKSFQNGSFIDLIEIDGASNRGIDDIRDLREKVSLAPSIGEKKIYIIDEVHMLTKEAFNALLKTLEEPPSHVVFVLCTTELHKVPDTIKSRCQVYKFKRATTAQIVAKLEMILKEEGVKKFKKEDLQKIAQASFGGFRDAETILQQVVEGNLDPKSFVGLSSKDIFITFVATLQKKETKEALSQLSNVLEEGLNINVWVYDLLDYLRDLLFVKYGALSDGLDVTKKQEVKIEKQASEISGTLLVKYIEEFINASSQIGVSVIPHLPLELAIVKLTNLGSNGVQKVPPKEDSGDDDYLSYEDDGEDVDVDVALNFDVPAASHTEKVEDDQELRAKATAEDALKELNADGFELLASKWREILKGTVEHNNSVHALLKSVNPLEVRGNDLVLEVLYKFHKERLESSKNRKIIEGVIADVTGLKVSVVCVINPDKRPKKKKEREVGELTDYNVSAPVFSADNPEELAEIFDGALPL